MTVITNKQPEDEFDFDAMEKAYLGLKSCIWFLTEEELYSLKRAIDNELKGRI